MIEYTITIKDDTTKLVERETSYEPILLTRDNPALQALVDKALEKFKSNSPGETPDIIIKTTMVW